MKKTKYYKCSICGLEYKEKKWRDKCHKWCEANPGTCDPNVAKYAVQVK